MTERFEEVTAAILAGGLGTRLRVKITDRPKILAPVHGRPYLAYLLDQLAQSGIAHAVLLTGYRGEQVRSTFGEFYAGMRLTYSQEPTPLGTAGAMRLALPCFRCTTVLLLNGDSFCAASLPNFWRYHCRHASDLSLVLTPVKDCSRYGRVRLGPEHQVERFEEKAAVGGWGWVNAGIYLLARQLIEEIPEDGPVSLERDMCPVWTTKKRCFGWPCWARFLDIGTPESYAQAEAFFSTEQRMLSA